MGGFGVAMFGVIVGVVTAVWIFVWACTGTPRVVRCKGQENAGNPVSEGLYSFDFLQYRGICKRELEPIIEFDSIVSLRYRHLQTFARHHSCGGICICLNGCGFGF